MTDPITQTDDPISLDIDYGLIDHAVVEAVADWEPPKHVYFGKKLANGRMEVEPTYKHQEFPKMLYAKIEGRVRADIAKDQTDLDNMTARGFVDSPAAFGLETAPSKDVATQRRIAQEKDEIHSKTETVQIVRRNQRMVKT